MMAHTQFVLTMTLHSPDHIFAPQAPTLNGAFWPDYNWWCGYGEWEAV